MTSRRWETYFCFLTSFLDTAHSCYRGTKLWGLCCGCMTTAVSPKSWERQSLLVITTIWSYRSHPDDIKAFNIAWKHVLIPTETGFFSLITASKKKVISAKSSVLYSAIVRCVLPKYLYLFLLTVHKPDLSKS